MVESSFDKLKALLGTTPVIVDAQERVGKEKDAFDEIESLLSQENRIGTEINKHITTLDGSQVLLHTSPETGKDTLVALIKRSISEKKVPIVVLFSTNYKSFLEVLAEAKINKNNVVIVDVVSKGLSKTENTEKVLFTDSLRNLTQLQITAVSLIEKNPNACFIFDSVCVLNLYHTEEVIMKFFYSMTKLLHKKGISGMYLVCKKQAVPKVIQFFDDFIELDQ